MIYVDFCFHVAATHLVVSGWAKPEDLAEPLALDDPFGEVAAHEPPLVLIHRRPDLAASGETGFIMVFALDWGGTDPDEGVGETTLTLTAGETRIDVAVTGDSLEDFVAFGSEEAFLALLGAVGRRSVPPLTGAGAALVFQRAMKRGASSHIHPPAFAGALDLFTVAPSVAAGVVTGWLLPATRESRLQLALVCLSAEAIAPVETAWGVLERPDLEGFYGRYAAVQPAGFVGTAGMPPATQPPAIMLVIENAGVTEVMLRPAEPVTFAAVVQRFGALAPRLETEVRTRLRGALAAGLGSVRPNEGFSGEESGLPLLVLEHDGRPRDLREVLGELARAGAAEIVLAGLSLDEDVQNAVEGARRDRPDAPRIVTAAGSDATLVAAEAGRPIIWARSSLLIQHDVMAFLAGVGSGASIGRLAVWDVSPRGLTETTPAGIAAEVARRGLVFAVALAGSAASPALSAQALLSTPGRLLWAFGSLAAEAAEVEVLSGTYFAGDRGRQAERPGAGLDFDLQTIAIKAGGAGGAIKAGGAGSAIKASGAGGAIKAGGAVKSGSPGRKKSGGPA